MKRVIRDDSLIIVIVPHKDITFDHKREITCLDSLIQYFNEHVKEGEIFHLNLERIYKDYDLAFDPPAGDLNSFKARTLENMSNRALHQTVFNTQLLLEMFNWAKIKILYVRTSLIIGHILIIGQKSYDPADEIQNFNIHFLSLGADWRYETVFRSEKTKK